VYGIDTAQSFLGTSSFCHSTKRLCGKSKDQRKMKKRSLIPSQLFKIKKIAACPFLKMFHY
jgi:hypothetical protein